MTSRRPLVLHVCESCDGGVPAAIKAMVGRAPQARHVVLFVRHRLPLGRPAEHPDATYIDAGPSVGVRAAMRLVARTYRELEPDVVHAHSSFAGVYVRTLPAIPRSKIVYSPHCFAFERRDVGRAARGIFRLVERVLARRTRAVVALSGREAELARSLSRRLDVVEARNVDDVPVEYRGVASAPRQGTLVVAASGRLCRQKDPSFFAAVVRAAGFDARWIWIGDGEDRYRVELESVGVEVTGWSDRPAVLRTLSESHVCLHTAAWETGVPIAVLEAAALGVPAVARAIPAMAGTEVARLVADPEAAAKEIELLVSPDRWEQESARTRSALEALLEEKSLGDGLSEAYGLAPVEPRKLLTSVA